MLSELPAGARSTTEAAVPLQVFNYAISPYEDWHDKAWAGAVVLIAMVFFFSAGARWLTRIRK